MDDRRFMVAALEMAEAGLGHVWPNPSVGAILVRDGAEVGRGQTQPRGRPHAEVVALDRAGPLAHGASMFVSLEPCCHHGRTPPCTDAILRAGVTRVVVACLDPFPEVNGRGVAALRARGVQVEVGLESAWAQSVNAGFFSRIRRGRPWFQAVAPQTGIPPGFDAMWRAGPGGGRLEVRCGATHETWTLDPVGPDGQTPTGERALAVGLEEAPARMAEEGLTRVAVEANSPAARHLSNQGSLDRDASRPPSW